MRCQGPGEVLPGTQAWIQGTPAVRVSKGLGPVFPQFFLCRELRGSTFRNLLWAQHPLAHLTSRLGPLGSCRWVPCRPPPHRHVLWPLLGQLWILKGPRLVAGSPLTCRALPDTPALHSQLPANESSLADGTACPGPLGASGWGLPPSTPSLSLSVIS